MVICTKCSAAMPSSFKTRTCRWISTSRTSYAGCGSSCSSPAPHAGYSFEQTLDLFLADVGGRVGTKPWQLQQASDAIRIYRYQYRGAKAGGGRAAGPPADTSYRAAGMACARWSRIFVKCFTIGEVSGTEDQLGLERNSVKTYAWWPW